MKEGRKEGRKAEQKCGLRARLTSVDVGVAVGGGGRFRSRSRRRRGTADRSSVCVASAAPFKKKVVTAETAAASGQTDRQTDHGCAAPLQSRH